MKIMMNMQILLLILVLSIAQAMRGEVVIRAAELTAFGVFEEYGKRFERGYSKSGPGTDSLKYVRFVDYNDMIPGELGISFGIQYVIHSSPRGKPFRVTGVITYPGDGLVTPTGAVYKDSEEDMEIRLGEKNFYGFGFDEPWEIIPGEWLFQIKHKETVLAQKTLIVLEPEQTL